MKKFNFKELLKGLLVICSYFLLTNILAIPFLFLLQLKIIDYKMFTLLLYLSLAIVYILIYKKDLIKDFKDLKNNYKEILKITFNYWIKGIFIMLASSLLFTYLSLEPNTNQQANIELLKQMPLIEAICAIILAPIIEELVFRRSLIKFTSNKHIYALTTGLIFGFIHVTSSINSINDLIMLLYIIPYSSVGIALGYAYKKTNNIYGSLIMHSIHNAIAILELIILGGFL